MSGRSEELWCEMAEILVIEHSKFSPGSTLNRLGQDAGLGETIDGSGVGSLFADDGVGGQT